MSTPSTADDDASHAASEPEVAAASDAEPDEHRSGLRNPAGAARGVGTAALILEAIVLLLALQPARQLSPLPDGVALAVLVGLFAVCLVVAGLMRYPWAWHLGTAFQVLVIVAGVVHWSLAVLGVVFLAIWIYVLRVRRFVTTTPGGPPAP